MTDINWRLIKKAINNNDRTEEQQSAVDKFCDYMDESIIELNNAYALLDGCDHGKQ